MSPENKPSQSEIYRAPTNIMEQARGMDYAQWRDQQQARYGGELPLDQSPAAPTEVTQAELSDASSGEVQPEGAGKVAGRAVQLAETAITDQPEKLHREVVNTPSGPLEDVSADLGDGVHMDVLMKANGVEAVAFDISEGNEKHTIGIVKPESADPKVLIDGKPAKKDEVPLAEEVITHIQGTQHEQANPQGGEKTPEEVAEIQAQADAKRRSQFATDFTKAYLGNAQTRDFLSRSGIDYQGIIKRLDAGEVAISQEQIGQMQKLAKEAQKNSPLWATAPGGGSMLQRAAEEKRKELADILKGI